MYRNLERIKMSDVYLSDWESLVKSVNDKASKILEKDVAPVAEEILKEHIKSDIYDVYTPKENGWVDGKTYERRNDLEDGVKSILQNNNTLCVTSTTKASPSVLDGYSFRNRYTGAFLKLLESGNMGIWKGGFPRPAVSNTEKDFETNSEIKEAIKNGIKREIGIYIEI